MCVYVCVCVCVWCASEGVGVCGVRVREWCVCCASV